MKLHCCYYYCITVIYRIISDQIIQWSQTLRSQFIKHFIALLLLTKNIFLSQIPLFLIYVDT